MTEILLGNIMPEEIGKRLGINLSKEHIQILKDTRQDNISIPLKDGNWHCFDLPFKIMCSDKSTAERIVGILRSYDEKNFDEPISIGWER